MSRCVADIRVLTHATRAHRRVELFLFADAASGAFSVLSFSGGHGRLPALKKGQGPLMDIDNARFVLNAIVRELEQMGYEPLDASGAIWEVYARKVHREQLNARAQGS